MQHFVLFYDNLFLLIPTLTENICQNVRNVINVEHYTELVKRKLFSTKLNNISF